MLLLVEVAGVFTESARLRQHGSDDTVGTTWEKLQPKRTTNASPSPRIVDSQVIHQTDMVIGIGIPRPIDVERRKTPAIGVAISERCSGILP